MDINLFTLMLGHFCTDAILMSHLTLVDVEMADIFHLGKYEMVEPVCSSLIDFNVLKILTFTVYLGG